MSTGNNSIDMNGARNPSGPEILGIISEWFEQAQRECSQISPRDARFVVRLCAVCLAIAKTYCRASACLLDHGFCLPAQALLRITAEIFVKVLWCVSAESEDEMKARQLQWERSSGKEKMKLLDELMKTPRLFNEDELGQLRRQYDTVKQEMQRNPETKHMPPVTGNGGLFALTSELFGANNMSALLYGQFCPAVHVDTSTLRGAFENVDGNLLVRDDYGDQADLATRCLNLAYVLLLTFRIAIGLPRTDLDGRYKEAVSALAVNRDKE